jgi:uncharacterized protein (DUF2384 family)
MSAVTVENLLGGKGVLKARPRSSLDWVEIVREGLPARVLDALAGNLKLTRGELAAALGIAERTLARRRKEGVFTAEESAKLLRLARVRRSAARARGSMAAVGTRRVHPSSTAPKAVRWRCSRCSSRTSRCAHGTS